MQLVQTREDVSSMGKPRTATTWRACSWTGDLPLPGSGGWGAGRCDQGRSRRGCGTDSRRGIGEFSRL